MNLARGDRRSLEYGQSGMCEDGLVRLACRPVLTRHIALVCSGSTPCEAIALVIGTHSMEAIASRQPSFEVIDA